MKTSWQCVCADAKQVWGKGQFQQANDNTDIKFFFRQPTMIMLKDDCPSIVNDTDTRCVFHEQTTMKRATCCCSLDGIKDADHDYICPPFMYLLWSFWVLNVYLEGIADFHTIELILNICTNCKKTLKHRARMVGAKDSVLSTIDAHLCCVLALLAHSFFCLLTITDSTLGNMWLTGYRNWWIKCAQYWWVLVQPCCNINKTNSNLVKGTVLMALYHNCSRELIGHLTQESTIINIVQVCRSFHGETIANVIILFWFFFIAYSGETLYLTIFLWRQQEVTWKIAYWAIMQEIPMMPIDHRGNISSTERPCKMKIFNVTKLNSYLPHYYWLKCFSVLNKCTKMWAILVTLFVPKKYWKSPKAGTPQICHQVLVSVCIMGHILFLKFISKLHEQLSPHLRDPISMGTPSTAMLNTCIFISSADTEICEIEVGGLGPTRPHEITLDGEIYRFIFDMVVARPHKHNVILKNITPRPYVVRNNLPVNGHLCEFIW